MAADKGDSKGGAAVGDQEADKRRKTICEALRHPMRVRILEVVNETPMSPSRFVDRGLGDVVRTFDKKSNALSDIGYHFRQLEKAGCIEIAELNARRGATEHVYRGLSRVFFSDEEFERMPLEERQDLSRTSFQGLLARTDGAIRSGSFDTRTDRHFTWRAMHLDRQGWDELMEALGGVFARAEQIREDAAARIAADSDEEVIPVTYGALGFQSPPQPLLY